MGLCRAGPCTGAESWGELKGKHVDPMAVGATAQEAPPGTSLGCLPKGVRTVFRLIVKTHRGTFLY